MKHSTILVALLVAAANFSDAAQAANSYLTNPMGLAYRYTTNVSQYGRPGGMVIASGCNRYDAAFATARANGAEILAYLNPVERPDYSICELDDSFYIGDPRRLTRHNDSVPVRVVHSRVLASRRRAAITQRADGHTCSNRDNVKSAACAEKCDLDRSTSRDRVRSMSQDFRNG